MIAYITIGVDDIGRAEQFYSAIRKATKLPYSTVAARNPDETSRIAYGAEKIVIATGFRPMLFGRSFTKLDRPTRD